MKFLRYILFLFLLLLPSVYSQAISSVRIVGGVQVQGADTSVNITNINNVSTSTTLIQTNINNNTINANTTLVQTNIINLSNSVSASTTLIQTNIINLITYSNTMTLTSTGGTVDITNDGGTNYNLEVAGTGSGTLTNGIGTNGITVTVSGAEFTAKLPDVIPSSDQFLRSDGSTVFWSTDRWPLPEIGTNYVIYDYVDTAPQDFVVPAGVSNVEVSCWGGGGSSASSYGGAGGFTRGVGDVSGIATLKVVVAHGGVSLDNGFAYFGGGLSTNVNPDQGGGLSGVYYGETNWCVIAGGGGASRGQQGGNGGGLSGGDGYGAYSGKGGTQTAGGAGASNSVVGLAGSYLQGGAATITYAGSGGGGYFGGGAGGTFNAASASSGGGSGYVSTNWIGWTARTSDDAGTYTAQLPPMMEDTFYAAGIAIGASTTSTDNGGNGRVVIKW